MDDKPEVQLPSFADLEGRTWELRITVADLASLRKLGKLELHDLGAALDRCGKLIGEPESLVSVLYSLCQAKAAAEGGPESFARGFAGQVLIAAARALGAACVDFFPLPPETGASLRERILNGSKAPTT